MVTRFLDLRKGESIDVGAVTITLAGATALEKTENAVLVQRAARFTNIGVRCCGNEPELARLSAALVKTLCLRGRGMEILRSRQQEHRSGREPANMLGRRELVYTHVEPAFGYPEHATSQPSEGRRIRRVQPIDESADDVVIKPCQHDRHKLPRLR